MKTQINRTEVLAYTKFERLCQQQMNSFYLSHGWEVKREPTKEYDLFLNKQPVEEKFRKEIHKDILIEILQDIPSAELGWFYKVRISYLYYAMCIDGEVAKLYIIDWPKFAKWWLEEYLVNPHKGLRGQYVISPKGYGLTLNLSVPIRDIPFPEVELGEYDLINQMILL